MNRFLVGDAGDIEKQELFVERPGDFIVAKHLPLEHRWSDAAADRDDDRASKQVEAYTTREVTEVHPATPNSALCGLGLRLLGHGDVDRGCSSRDPMTQTHPDQIGFIVQPLQVVVARFFAWIHRNRRKSSPSGSVTLIA